MKHRTKKFRGTLKVYKTENDIPQELRLKLNVLANQGLADAVDLQMQIKQAHWNVKGPSFIALHKLFDEIVDAAEEYMDLIAERVVQLGGTAEGTIQNAAKRSSLKEYPVSSSELDHVETLSSALASYGKSVRHAIDQSDELGDRDTADIFTEISRGADKYLWFVEAHLG